MTTALGACKWCGLEKRLIRAHIIPRTFYHAVRGEAPHALLIDTSKAKYTRAYQSGIIDSQILCTECDGRLGPLDEHGFRVLGQAPPEQAIAHDRDGIPVGYRLDGTDTEKTRRFVLSVIWRAGVSQEDFFASKLTLGPYLNRIKAALESPQPLSETDWPMIVIRFFNNRFDRGIFPPHSGRMGKVRCVCFYLPYFKIVAKMDQQSFPQDLWECRFSSENGSLAVRLPIDDSPEMRYLNRVATSLRQRGAKPKKS